LGFKVGDLVWTGAFPGIIISDVGTYAPCCEVFGFEQECGSAYAKDLRHLTREEFVMQCSRHGYSGTLRVYSKKSYAALKALNIAVEMR